MLILFTPWLFCSFGFLPTLIHYLFFPSLSSMCPVLYNLHAHQSIHLAVVPLFVFPFTFVSPSPSFITLLHFSHCFFYFLDVFLTDNSDISAYLRLYLALKSIKAQVFFLLHVPWFSLHVCSRLNMETRLMIRSARLNTAGDRIP